MCIKHVVEARRELKAYLYSLKEQFAGIDKMKALTKEEKVNLFFILIILSDKLNQCTRAQEVLLVA